MYGTTCNILILYSHRGGPDTNVRRRSLVVYFRFQAINRQRPGETSSIFLSILCKSAQLSLSDLVYSASAPVYFPVHWTYPGFPLLFNNFFDHLVIITYFLDLSEPSRRHLYYLSFFWLCLSSFFPNPNRSN